MSVDRVRIASAVPTTRTSRVECTLGSDPRLLVSIGAMLAHAAKRAGLLEKTQEDVAAAVIGASRETPVSANGKGDDTPAAKLLMEEFSDRVEVTIESPAGAALEGIRKGLEGKAADRMRCEARDGRVLVTLLKPCGAAKSNSTV